MLASARKPIPAVVGEAFAEAHRRDPDHARPWFAVVDGNNAQIGAIRSYAAQYQVNVPVLIDFIHVVQYLWKAAGSFFYPGGPEARAWVRAQAAKILDGKARDVQAGVAAAPPPTATAPKNARALTPAPITWKTRRTTSTTPPSSPPDGRSPAG